MHGRTHCSKIKNRVDDSCLFQSLYSRKVAGTIIILHLPSFSKKKFPGINRKSEHHHWILRIPINLCANLQLKLTIIIFITKFGQKGYFQSKREKVNNNHWILLIQISLDTKFQLKLTVLIFLTKFAQKGYFPSKTEKSHLYVISYGGRQTQWYFNVSSPSSRRDNNSLTVYEQLSYFFKQKIDSC